MRLQRFALGTAAVCCGFSLMGLEIMAGRVLSPWFGSSVHVWGAVLTVFMLGLATGYYFGGILADGPRISARRPAAWLFAAGTAVSASALLSRPVCALIESFSWDERYGALSTGLILFIIPAILLGISSPLLMKSWESSFGRRVGGVLALSTLGCVAGAWLVSFYLVVWLGSLSIGLLLGGLLFFPAGILCITRGKGL